MTDAHVIDRAERAQRIMAAPDHFKICEGCDSIVAARVDTCPNCHAYRFNDDPLQVVLQAQELASRPQTTVTASDME